MDSSVGIGTSHQPGAQNEPFFELLQPTVSSSSAFSQNSTQSSTKKMENNSGEFDFGGGDNVLPSFDFQPIRPSGVSSSKTSNPSAGRMEESRSRQASPPPTFTPYEPMVRRSREPPPTYEAPLPRSQELEKESFETATVAAVERTMKKYADNLLRVLEGLTGRLSQLESSTQRLEHLYGEIRNAVVNNHGETDGKLRSLENHILEVQRGVQLLRDRQELAEAQSQLAKLQAVTKSEVAPHSSSAPSAPLPVAEQLPELTRAPSGKALLEASQQQLSNMVSSSHYQQPQPQQQQQQQLQLQLPSIPPHSQPPSLPQQPQAPQQQQQQQPQQQQLHQAPPLQQPSEVSHQSLHQQPPPPSQQMTHPHHPPPPPPSQMSVQPFYSQQQQQPPPQPQAPPPPMPTYGHQPEAPPYNQHPQGPHHVLPPAQSYSPDLPSYHPSSYGPPVSVPQPSRSSAQMPPSSHIQQQHSMYDTPITRNGSGQLALPPPYLPQAQQVTSSSMYEPQSPGSVYPSSSYRVAQPVPSAPGGGGSGYPRLPVAQPLPHALPAGGSGGGAPGTPPLSTNRVPIDEVIEKVTQMGFSKDQVRAVVRRLTENGQSVDLNIVLDKLMNGGDSQPPPKGWFGR